MFGVGPDFRVIVLFGGDDSAGVAHAISETTLLLMTQKKGSWVVERVVGSGELRAPDDSLREQLKRLQITPPLSDERAQEIIDKALESSSLQMRNLVAIITGLMGSGKTWLLSRLFNQQPPDLYTSTGIAEQSFRGLLHHMMSLTSWQQFSHGNILEYLASVFREEIPPVEVVDVDTTLASIQISEPAQPPLPTLPSASSSPSSSVSPPAEASAPQPKPPSQLEKTTTGQSMVRLVKAPQSSQSLTMLELIHMIDTGGQPELMEHMPSLVYCCHLAVLVLNLMFGPDEYPPVHFHVKGKAYKRALPSQHTGRQTIQQLACTLQAKRFTQKEGQCFRLLVVGTHRDCVEGDLAARVKEYDDALRAILLPACHGELIRYSATQIPFVLNLKNPDTNDISTLELMRTKVSESEVGEVINMPGAFLVFEQVLMEFAKKKGRDILSFSECLEVGGNLKMKAEDVQAALIFFHRQITFLYFQYVLPNLVFTKPQTPLDFANAVVRFSYKVKSGEEKGVEETLASSLRDGIITEEILGHKLLSKCFIPNLYEPHDAIDLLLHTFSLAPLSREPQSKTDDSKSVQPAAPSREKREYLMMSLCPAIPNKQLSQYIPAPSEIAPLVVKFSKDCVPMGCFSSTISCLLSLYDWQLSRLKDGSPECLAHNLVSLSGPQLPVQIVLADKAKHLEIHVHAQRDIISPQVCFRIHEIVFAAIEQVFKRMNLSKIDISPACLCSCSTVSEAHSALFQKSVDSKWYLQCSRTHKTVGSAQEEHRLWLDVPDTEKEKPSLPKCHLLNIPETVGAEYRRFGTILLNDGNGTLVDAIEHDCNYQCHRISSKILQKWILGTGKPPTWRVLVETLRDCKLNVLADQIQTKYL
jgi:hypothetical protein